MQRDNRRSREDGGGGYEPTSTFADVEAAAMLESGERKRRLEQRSCGERNSEAAGGQYSWYGHRIQRRCYRRRRQRRRHVGGPGHARLAVARLFGR